jgi:uncharacterized protein (TIGR03083 family)
MEHSGFLEYIRREGAAMTSAARVAGVDAAVPSCPEWSVADLLSHLGRIHRYVTGIVIDRPSAPTQHWSTSEPADVAVRIEWFEDGYHALADALGSARPSEPSWSWTPDRTVGFWARRQAHELAVHRWDAQLAAGEAQPIDAQLAVDGIQEVFDILPSRPRADEVRGGGETIHLHCTDVDGEWLLRLDPDGLAVTREHAKGDVAARGTASDLELLLCGRIPPERVEVFGDAALLTRWQEIARF